MTDLKKVFICLLIFGLGESIYAQWQPLNGPYGADVLCLSYNGKHLFCGTAKGVYRSSDRGNSWVKSEKGISKGPVRKMLCSGARVFAATDQGAFRSVDSGVTWQSINDNIVGEKFNCLAFDGHTLVLSSPGNGLYFSFDFGENWFERSYGIAQKQFSSLMIHGSKVYMGTMGDGLYVSEDTGKTWQLSKNGLTSNDILDLAVCNDSFFAASAEGVFRSADQGVNWKKVPVGLESVDRFNVFSVMYTMIYVGSAKGVFYSQDLGDHWLGTNLSLKTKDILALQTVDHAIFAGSPGSGVYLSESHGYLWRRSDIGINEVPCDFMLTKASQLFVNNHDTGIAVSSDNGKSWTVLHGGLPDSSVQILQSHGNTLYAGTRSGFFVSNNGGHNWARLGDPSALNDVRSIFIEGPEIHVGTLSSGIYVSRDTGSTWNLISNGLSNNSVFAFCRLGGEIHCGTSDGLFRFNSSQEKWEKSGLENHSVNQMLNNGRYTFVNTSDSGVYVSSDSGRSWKNCRSSNRGKTNTMAFYGSDLLVGTDSGLIISKDSGVSWQVIPTGELTDRSIACIASNGDFLFVGLKNGGKWRLPLARFSSLTIKQSFNYTVHPNPGRRFFTLSGLKEACQIDVFNARGSKMRTLFCESGADCGISLEDCAPGVYYILITEGETKVFTKIIIY